MRQTDDFRILCECGNRRCHDWITLNSNAYNALRREASWFIVALGHEVPELLDHVKQRHAAFTVVEARLA